MWACCWLCPAGGERVLEVFDVKLKEAIYKLPFDKILTLKNVSHRLGHSRGERGLGVVEPCVSMQQYEMLFQL